MFGGTAVRRIGTISTALANAALFAAGCSGVEDSFAVLFWGGVLFRTLSLPITLYGDRCLARAACALPELQEADQQYREIIDHPRAIFWEKKVAAQKLKNDRDRIFRSHRTDNVRLVLLHGIAVMASWYTLCIPAQQLSDCIGASSVLVKSPLAFHALGITMDPTLALAGTLTFINTWDHMRRRMGFNDGLDAWLRQLNSYMFLVWGVFAPVSFLVEAVAGIAGLFPSYLAPVWLGISVTSSCKSALVNHTAPMRALFAIPDYPVTHGTHGVPSTAEAHEYRLLFTGVDVEERRDMWQTQKKALDYECNVRLHRMLKRLGLFDRVEEAEHEAEKLQMKLDVAQERRRQRELQQQQQYNNSNGDTYFFPAPRSVDGVGVSAESVAARQFDEMQVQENERRQQRRRQRETMEHP